MGWSLRRLSSLDPGTEFRHPEGYIGVVLVRLRNGIVVSLDGVERFLPRGLIVETR